MSGVNTELSCCNVDTSNVEQPSIVRVHASRTLLNVRSARDTYGDQPHTYQLDYKQRQHSRWSALASQPRLLHSNEHLCYPIPQEWR